MKTSLPLEEYVHHRDICRNLKADIEPLYQKILDYTDTTGIIATQYNGGNASRRTVNATIAQAKVSLKNFVMYSLYGIKTQWAKADVITALLRKSGASDEALEAMKKKIKEKLNAQNDDIFEYIMASNYEKEIGRAISDWGELGTGCWEYIEQESDTNPFVHRYVPLNELEFNEDDAGEPNIVFRYRFQVTPKYLRERFPNADLSIFYGYEDTDKVDVLECVMPVNEFGMEKEYEWILFNGSMDRVLEVKRMKYNPYTIFRFMITSGTPWGLGVGAICLDSYERLCYYENLRARQSSRIVEPPLAYIGEKAFGAMFDPNPNALNWFGEQNGNGNPIQVFPVNTTGNLLPIQEDIDRFTQNIQLLHFNQPFGSADNKTTRATEEIQYRMQIFQQQFSDAVSNLYTEVLIPSFQKPRIILMEKGLVEAQEEDKYLKIKFVNALTRSVDSSKVENLVMFKQSLQVLVPQQSEYVLNAEETIQIVKESMGVEDKMVNKYDEIEAGYQQALQNSLQMQRLAGMADGLAEGGDNGLV